MAGSDNDSLFSNFFAELRRRRVIRVVVVYVIVGWVVIEVASTMMPGLHLPAWTVTLVIALVVLGFPIAVALAWLFDLGPRGIERTVPLADAAEVKSAIAEVPEAAKPVADAARPAAKANDDRRTIAVLPFVNMSGDADNEYFSDGISEELLNLLTKLSQLKVSSRTSSFNLKGKEVDIPTAARQLGVSTILEGSVRRAGERVRITAQLIDAESDSHLWSESYDREMKDVFAIQDDIAHSIVKALQVTLSPKERRSIQSVATADAQAYDYYLRGRNYMYSMERRDYVHAIHMFEQAIGLDSKYAAAYAGMADAYSHIYRFGATPENAAKADSASEQALLLDPESAEARASRGYSLFISKKYDEAEREFDTAIKLNPNRFETYYEYGRVCAARGHFEKAAELYVKASEINPADYQAPVLLAQVYASLGRKHDQMKVILGAVDTLERYIKLNPHDARALCWGAGCWYRVGEHTRAIELAEQALEQRPDEPNVLYNVACFYVIHGKKERALDLLEKSVELGLEGRDWLETDSDLDPLRQEDRFKALISRMH